MTIVLLAASSLLGFLVARVLLERRDFFSVGSLTVVIGPAVFLTMANALGYVLPIQTAFWATLGAILACDLLLLLLGWKMQRLSVASIILPPRGILLAFMGIISICTVAYVRYPGSDPLAWHHLPLAATISEGNFPVHEPVNPDQRMAYHYGGALLAAAVHEITGLSVAAGYGLQPLFGVAGILLSVAALVFALTRSARTALVAGVLAFGAAGLMWLKVVWLLRDLFEAFILGVPIATPFRELAPMFSSPIGVSPLIFLGHRSLMNGYPLFFALLYCLYEAFGERSHRRLILWVLLCIILMSGLALTMETGFLLLFPALASYSVVLWLWCRGSSASLRRVILVSAAVLLPSLVIARFQGGVLFSQGADVGPSAFSFGFFPYIYTTIDRLPGPGPDPRILPVWSFAFLRDLWVPVFLLPIGAFFCWRRRRAEPFPLLLCIIALGHFLVPLVVHFQTRLSDLNRLFITATSLSAIVTGLWIDAALLSSASAGRRRFGRILIALMLASSTVCIVFRLLFPTSRFEAAPLIATMPAASSAERALFSWVREHTTLADRFYLRIVPAIARGNFNLPEEVSLQRDRIVFMAYTARYGVGPLSVWWTYPPSLARPSLAIEERCSRAAFQKLRIRFLVVLTEDRAAWFADHCSLPQWRIAYDGADEGRSYPRIYELRSFR